MATPSLQPRTLPVGPLAAKTLGRVFWRSLFILAAWNSRGMQNHGFAYAVCPALEELYPNNRDLARAAERHLSCFNSHPYFAAAILGGAIHHEERIARGEESPEAVNAFKQSLMGPLAALGDGFFWLSLRPACGALSALLALVLAFSGWPAAAVLASVGFYLVAYNLVHVALRIRLFLLGYRLGDKVVPVVASLQLPSFGKKLRVLAAAGAGATSGLAFMELSERGQAGLWAPAGSGALFVASYLFLGKRVSPYLLAYGAVALALFTGLVF